MRRLKAIGVLIAAGALAAACSSGSSVIVTVIVGIGPKRRADHR